MPSAIAAANAATPVNNPTNGAPATNDSTMDKDMFLQLMVAQMRYQNPLQPTDPTQFMTQTAQFTMVEQLQNLSTSQADSLRWTRMSLAQSMVGSVVEVTDPYTGVSTEAVVHSLRATVDGPLLKVEATDGSGHAEVFLEEISQVFGKPAAVTAPETD